MKLYPKIIERTVQGLLEWADEVNGSRTEDRRDNENLPSTFVLGRNRTLLNNRAEPTSSSDVVATDAEGDFFFSATTFWVLVDTGGGTLEWVSIPWGGGGGGGAPTTAQYVTLALNGSLSAERVLTAGNGITITDNGANSAVVIAATGSPNLDGGLSNSTYGAVSPIDGGASV